MPPQLDFGSRTGGTRFRPSGTSYQPTGTTYQPQRQSLSEIKRQDLGLYVDVGASIIREIPGYFFNLFDKAEKLGVNPLLSPFGRKPTSYFNNARIWTEKKILNPALGLPQESTSERSDLDEVPHYAGRTREEYKKGSLWGTAKYATATAFWGAINLADIIPGVGAVRGAIKTAKTSRALGKIPVEVITEVQMNAVRAAQKQSREAAIENILKKKYTGTELISITGKTGEVETVTKALSELADKAVRTEVPERLVTETRRTAAEVRKLSNEYVEIPERIDAIEIARIDLPNSKTTKMSGIQKGALVSYNAMADAFNKVSNSRAARAIKPYDPKGYKEFFTAQAKKFQDASKKLIDAPKALTSNELKKIRLNLGVLKDAMKNDFNQFLITTNLDQGVALGLTATQRKNLLETLQRTAAREIDTNFNNAFKIISRRRTAAQLDAELLSGKYMRKLQDLEEAGVPVKAKKSTIIGNVVERATKIKDAAKASKFIQDEIYKNYAKATSRALRPYLKSGILKSFAVPQSAKSGLIRDVNREIAKFVKGDATAEQLNEILSVTLNKDGSSILNSSSQRRQEIENLAESTILGNLDPSTGERVGGFDLSAPMFKSDMDDQSFKLVEKNLKEAIKNYDKKVKNVGRDAAKSSPESIVLINATDNYSDALILRNTDFAMPDHWNPRTRRLLWGGHASAGKKIAKGRFLEGLLHSQQAEAVQTSGLKRFHMQPSTGDAHPVVKLSIENPVNAFDDAESVTRELNQKYLYSIDPELRTYLRKNKIENFASLTAKGTMGYHAKYYAGLLLENLASSKLSIDDPVRIDRLKKRAAELKYGKGAAEQVGTMEEALGIIRTASEAGEKVAQSTLKLHDRIVEGTTDMASTITKALGEHGVKDVSVTPEDIKKYVDTIDLSADSNRLASKKRGMSNFRRDVLKLDAGVEKIFDDKIYPYLEQIGDFYDTKVRDGYEIMYGKEAPKKYDFWMPLASKEGRFADDSADLKFLDMRNEFVADDDVARKTLLSKPDALNERNANLADGVYALDGEKLYGTSVQKVIGFGHAAPHMYFSKQLLDKLGNNLNKNVKDSLYHHLGKMSGQQRFRETAIEVGLKYLGALAITKFLFSPQFAGGTYAARGIESLAGISKASRKYRAPGEQLLKQNPDFKKRIIEEVIPERYEDNINSARADIAMLERQRNSSQGNSIRGNFLSGDNFSNMLELVDNRAGRKLLHWITKPERNMYPKVVAGSALERFNKIVKKQNPNIPEDVIVYPNDWDEFVEVIGGFSREKDLLGDIYGEIAPSRRAPIDINADALTSTSKVFASWTIKAKQRLGTAYMHDRVRKMLGNKYASDLRLTYEDSQTFWDALSDIVESEAHYQMGRSFVRNGLLKAAGEDDESFTDNFTRSVRDNMTDNAFSIGWAGQVLSEPVLSLLRGHYGEILDVITDPVSDIASAKSLTDAFLGGLKNVSFWGNFVLGDSSPMAPFRDLYARIDEKDKADQHFRKEVSLKFKRNVSIAAGIEDALNFYRRGSEEAVPWHTVEISSFKELNKAKEEILAQAQRFSYRTYWERLFGESETDNNLGGIKAAASAANEKGGAERNLRSLYTLLIMPKSDWKALENLAQDVANASGKTHHIKNLDSWRKYRRADGSINDWEVKRYVNEIVSEIKDNSTESARDNKQFFGNYENYLEKIVGLTED